MHDNSCVNMILNIAATAIDFLSVGLWSFRPNVSSYQDVSSHYKFVPLQVHAMECFVPYIFLLLLWLYIKCKKKNLIETYIYFNEILTDVLPQRQMLCPCSRSAMTLSCCTHF